MAPKAKIINASEMGREIRSAAFWRDAFAEFIGTFFLVAIQCMVPIKVAGNSVDRGPVGVGLAMGFVVLVLIETFGSMSGGVFNPAVAVGLLVANKITLLRGIVYIIAQVAGGITGAALAYGVTPSTDVGSLAGTSLGPGVAWWQGLLVEVWLTALLMFAVQGATNERSRMIYMPAIPIGLTVALDIITGFYYTGGSMNPARSLGPAVFVGDDYPDLWKYQYIYWAGPILGSCLAAVIYTHCMNRLGNKDTAEISCDAD